MNYIIAGSGRSPNDLDKEHIVNTMFKVARYCKNAYFMNGSESVEFALESARKWKDLNGFDVKLIPFDINNRHDMDKMPDIVDAFIFFLDEGIEMDNDFLEQQMKAQEDDLRVDKYILGSWDKHGQNLCGND